MKFTANTTPALEPRRVVLDTNIVLDLWLFHDPRVCALGNAILNDQIKVFTEPACTEELRRVLSYPVFAMEECDQAALLKQYKNVAIDLALDVNDTDLNFKVSPVRCSDPDDQKFLNLAWRTGADLLSRDKAILVLRRRYAVIGGGTICEPEFLFPPVEPCIGETKRLISESARLASASALHSSGSATCIGERHACIGERQYGA